MTRVTKAEYSIAWYLGADGEELREYRYQPTRSPLPIYTPNDGYYCATASKKEPKRRSDYFNGFECERWKLVQAKSDNFYGMNVWQAEFEQVTP